MALVDRITWALNEEDLREYLSLTTGEDLQLQLWLESAVECADAYLEPDTFQDEDTGADLPIPQLVLLGVYEWVRIVRNVKQTNNVSASGAAGPATTIKTGDNSITFDKPGVLEWTSGSARTQANQVAKSYWCKLKPDVLLGL